MKKQSLIFLLSFEDFKLFYVAWNSFILKTLKKFKEVYFLNSDNFQIIKESTQKVRVKSFEKKYKAKFINIESYNDLDNFLNKKKPLIINCLGKGLNYYRLFYFLRKKKIPQVAVSNIGNIQAPVYYWMNYNFKFIKYYLFFILPQKLTALLASIGIFSKIDIRFESNKKIVNGFEKNRKRKLFKIPTYYKEMINVKSRNYDQIKSIKTKVKEDIILLIDMEPDYRHMNYTTFNKTEINNHYQKLNILLSNLQKNYKKKVIISIHPLANLNNAKKHFKNFKVIRFKTKELIKKSMFVLFFDSSAILDAVYLKKTILCLRSNLFKQKKYNSDLYKDILKLKTIDMDKKLTNYEVLINSELKKKKTIYNDYLKKYTSGDFKMSGADKILEIIKKKYF